MRAFLVLAIIAFFVVGIIGCERENDQRNSDRVDEEVAREIEEDLDRELERAEEHIEELRDRIEDRFDDAISEEELEEIGREVEESVSTGLARVGRVLEDIGTKIQEDADVTVVDYREFYDLLPEEFEGMDLVDTEGANKDGLGMRLSKLEAEYEGDDAEMEVTILDMGTMKGMLKMGFDFLGKEIDEENRDGFERTRKFGGFPGFQSVEYDDDETEMTGVVIIDNRFVVALEVEGEDIDKDFVDEFFDEFPLRRLRRLQQ